LKVRRGNLAAAAAVLVCGVLAPAAEAGAGGSTKTKLISVSGGGNEGNDHSNTPSISVNGRFVAFDSRASNLVRSDGNDLSDVFVRDVKTGRTRLVSVGVEGADANGSSYFASVSAGGRFVAFVSGASNLVRGDSNRRDDVFVRDLNTGETRLVSIGLSGAPANGRKSLQPSISANGRLVAFRSYASNLVAGDTNGRSDVFVRDLDRGQTWRVSVRSNGAQANDQSLYPSISADGRFVAFRSHASNLWQAIATATPRSTSTTSRRARPKR
jgi:TolB protein